MTSEVEQNKYEKLFINSNIKVDNAIMFFHKTFDAMRLSGIGSAPKLIAMLNELIEGKACMNVSFEEIIKEREEALNASADTVLNLALAGAIKPSNTQTLSAKQLSELRINDPETQLQVEQIVLSFKEVQEELYKTRIQSEHYSNELNFARQVLAKHSIDCKGEHGERIHYGIERLLGSHKESVPEPEVEKAAPVNKSFIVYWYNGTTSTVVGKTFAEAFALGDFGCGMQTSINFWEEGETPNPKYEYYGDEWIETSKHT